MEKPEFTLSDLLLGLGKPSPEEAQKAKKEFKAIMNDLSQPWTAEKVLAELKQSEGFWTSFNPSQ